MVNFDAVYFGARLYIWLFFIFSLCSIISILVYFFREKIKEKYYKTRYPEKVIRCIMHYPNNMYKTFFRLIPTGKYFYINKIMYVYSDRSIIKENDIYTEKKNNALSLRINGKTYKLDDVFKIKNRWDKTPTIHYFFNSPDPIDFDIKKHDIKLNSSQFQELKENDLVSKLLSLSGQDQMLLFILIGVLICFVGILAIVLKVYEVAK